MRDFTTHTIDAKSADNQFLLSVLLCPSPTNILSAPKAQWQQDAKESVLLYG